MPSPNLSDTQITDLLNRSIDLKVFELPESRSVVITCIVNYNGRAFGYKTVRPVHSQLGTAIINSL